MHLNLKSTPGRGPVFNIIFTIERRDMSTSIDQLVLLWQRPFQARDRMFDYQKVSTCSSQDGEGFGD